MQAVRSVLHSQEERCIAQQYVRMVQVVDCRGTDNRADISLSGHSIRHLKSLFYKYLERAPQWTIKRREAVNLLIDGTYFRNKVCLVVYRGHHIKSTLFYRLTDREREWEIIQDLQTLKALGIRIERVSHQMATGIS